MCLFVVVIVVALACKWLAGTPDLVPSVTQVLFILSLCHLYPVCGFALSFRKVAGILLIMSALRGRRSKEVGMEMGMGMREGVGSFSCQLSIAQS